MGSELCDTAAHLHRVDDAGGDAERKQECGLLALVLRTRLRRPQLHATDRIGCIRDTKGPLPMVSPCWNAVVTGWSAVQTTTSLLAAALRAAWSLAVVGASPFS